MHPSCLSRLALSLALLASLFIAQATEAQEAKALSLGTAPELFVDHAFIDSMKDASLKLWDPRLAENVLTFDKPWEMHYCGYVTVIQDGDLYRMYYRGLPKALADGSDAESTCYAESKDGIHWTKPNLGIYEFNGSKDNNIILKDHAPFSHNFAPFLDSRPGVPANERFKAIAGTHKLGLYTFVSPDGIHWSEPSEKAIITDGAFDSQNVAFWSESEQQYVCYFRIWSESDDGFGKFVGHRSIGRSTSPDFVNWSPTIKMTYGKTLPEHLYTNQTIPYYRNPALYIALAARFMPGRRAISEKEFAALGGIATYSKDCSDTVFMSSRGGTSYDRTFMEGFVRPGLGLNNWSSRTNYPARGVVQTSDEAMSFYVQRDYGQTSHHLQRMELRIDGFASAHAPYSGGTLRTKVLTLQGNELVLNYATSAAGSVWVELQSPDGTPIPGFTRADCDEMLGDFIERAVIWKGNSDLSTLKGKPLRIVFTLKDADVFSMLSR
mgnify:CR=1 FL=1